MKGKKRRKLPNKVFYAGKYRRVVYADDRFYYLGNGERVLRSWAEESPGVKCSVYFVNFGKKDRGLQHIHRWKTKEALEA